MDDMAPQISSPITPHLPNGLATVEQEIARACKEARRDRTSVTLIAVSKTFGAETIVPAIEAGQRVFGENRVQEARAKWPGLIPAYPGIALHLIGPLQSNKAKEAVAPAQADAVIASCRDKYGLQISGLMCIPPLNDAPAPHFALTAKIAARNGLKNLSMGMSADFAVAIQFGATHVRIGSAIFGAR
jgi:PLP dependent protein